MSASTDVAIVGMAGRFPGARSVEEFWANLRDGVESVTRYTEEELRAAGVSEAMLQNPSYVRSGAPLQDMEWFDAGFFGFSPREAAILDPQHRHFLECAWEALEHAGHAPASFPGLIGLFAGSGHNAYLPYNLLTNPELVRSVGLFLLRHTGNDKDFLATRASYLLDLRGPSLNIQTACSTSLVAVHVACQSLLNRECDLALAGGVTIELPHRQGYLHEEGEILSPDGHCRAFDAASAGTIFGSGAGAVVLRRLSDAVADGDTIYAVVKGSAVNNDGSDKVGYLAPSVGGQARAIAEALAVGGVDPSSVSYVETHGTGTPVGDPIEIAALTQAFRQGTDRVGFCGIGSVKTNVGHLDTAAGVASLIKVIQALRHDEIPASLHFESPNPALALERSPFRVVSKRTPWRPEGGPRRAGVSSLGVGGTNAHVVVEEAPPAAATPPARTWQLLPFSARSAQALDASARNLAAYLGRSPQEALADVAWTLQAGRTAHPLRRYVVARSAAEAAAGLSQPEKVAPPPVERDRPIAFLFAGGGAQHVGMGRELHRDEPAYRAAVDECLALTDPGLVGDLRRLLLEAEPGDASAAGQMERPSLGLPALFITQYANARLWTTWGIEPDSMIGHSMGEYSAALLAGVFELRHALALVELRGRLFEKLPPGAMLSVSLGEDQLRPLLGAELSVAAANAPELSVASGPRPAIDALERELTAREVDCARIRIGVAAHSTMLEPILGEFAAFLKRTRLKPPTVPFVSNVSGTWVTAAEATDPLYWVRHLRQTVRFAEGVGELLANPGQACLEIGPGRTLATLARLHPRRLPSHVLATSLRHPGDSEPDMAMMLSSLGRLWQSGVEIDWRLVHGAGRRRVALPTYPFQRERHWIEPGKTTEAPPEQPAGRQADLANWFWEPEWVRSPLQTAPPRPEAVALLLGERGAILDRLAERLERAGCRAVVAVPATDCAEEAPGRWTVDPTSAAHLETVLRSMVDRGQPPTTVLHLLTLTRTPASPALALDRSVFSAMGLGRAIGTLDLASPLRVLAIGHGLFDVAGEGVDDGYKATVAGPIRVLPREVPTVTSGVIDVRLPPAGSPAEADLIDRVVAEIGAPPGDETVALRGGDRWVERYVARPRRPAAGSPSRLRNRGRYLITGGLGGLGLTLALHLAKDHAARLALVGRSGLPPRDQWDDVLRRTPNDPAASRIRSVRKMEEAGAEVLVVPADVVNEEAIRAAVDQVVGRFGGLDGVFHAAGTIDDGLLALKSRESAQRVLAPKVQGTVALAAALAATPLEFVALFSSVSSFAGIAGQADYAAANVFLDGFARHLSRVAGVPAVAIGWSAWRDVGMVAARAGGEKAEGSEAGDPVEPGYPFFDRQWQTPDGRVFAARLGAERHWLLGEHRVRGGDALIPGTGHLELARAAFERTAGPGPTELSDVGFASPFVVSVGEERALELRLTGSPDRDMEFVVLGLGAGEPGWTEHVRGIVRRPKAPAEPVDLAAVRARCTRRVVLTPKEAVSAHLDFGPRWSNVTEISFGDGEALVALELPARFEPDLQALALHPALFDMATAGAQQLVPGIDVASDFLVPVSYGRVVLHHPLTARALSLITVKPGSTRDEATFDVRVVDPTGRVLVTAEDFTMIRVRDRARLDAHHERAGHALLKDAIRPAEGVAALDRILAGPLPERVVVSPVPLAALLASVRTPPGAPEVGSRARPASGRDLRPVTEALLAHEAVADVAAADRRDQAGERRLVAWVAFKAGEQATASELRRHLKERVPEDLVAQAFVEVDAIPRKGGEPDWPALVSPFGEAEAAVGPRNPTEQAIAEIWCELLGVQAVSVRDNFFDIGGHSLLSVRFVARLHRRLQVRLLHEHVVVHTLEQLAAMCDSMARAKAS